MNAKEGLCFGILSNNLIYPDIRTHFCTIPECYPNRCTHGNLSLIVAQIVPSFFLSVVDKQSVGNKSKRQKAHSHKQTCMMNSGWVLGAGKWKDSRKNKLQTLTMKNDVFFYVESEGFLEYTVKLGPQEYTNDTSYSETKPLLLQLMQADPSPDSYF